MPTAEPDRRDRLPRAFRWFWVGEGVSDFGSWITLLALDVLVVKGLHAGTTGTGLLSAARWLPYLLLGVLLGAVLDRRARRPVMIATDLVRAVLLLLIPLAWWADVLSLPVLLAIVFGFGTATLMNDGASQAFVPRLVPRGQLQTAHARLDGTRAVAQTGGPAVGGALVGLVGAPLAVLANAGTFLFSAAVVSLARADEPVRDPEARPDLRREIGEGLRWVYRGGSLRHLAVWTHVWFAGQAALGAVLAVYLLVDVHLHSLWFGLVTAAAGIGALFGAAASMPLGARMGSGRTVILGHVVSAVGVLTLLTASVAPGRALVLALLFLGQGLHGFAMGTTNSHEMAYRQSITPDEMQVRTNITMRSMNRAVVVVVAPLAGVLAEWGGTRPLLAVAACLFALTAIGLWRSPFRHADLVRGAA